MVGAAVSLQSPGGGAMSVGVSTGCNSAGTTGTVSNVVILCGGSNVTLSESINGQSATITIIGGAGAGASFDGGVSSGGNTLGTTGTVSKEIIFVGGSNITLSQSSIAGGSATITIIGASAAATGAFSGGVSDLGNTLGTTGTVSNEIVFVGGSNITLSQSINANSATITVNALSQSQQTQNIIRDVIISGNTSGTTADISSGTLVLVGGAGLILFQNANSITFSVSSHYSAGVSNLGNTSGTTGTVGDLLVLAGGNNITLSQSVNLQSATVTISSPNMLSGGISNLGNTAGTSGAASELLILVGGSNITLSQSIDAASSVATVTIVGQSQSLQTQSIVRDVVISGNTTGTTADISSGTLTLAGGNNITLSQVGNAITISGGTADGAAFSAGVSSIGNTSGSTGTVSNQIVFVGGNNITLSQSTNGNSATVTISAFNQTVQTQNLFDLTLSGNTSGTLALVSTGTLTLAGGNQIVLSQVGNAITISASQTVQTQSIIRDVNISGNTSGTTADISSGTLILAGGNGIILSQDGQSITISGHELTAGISAGIGNTSGTTGLVHDRLVFAGGNNITLSQSVNLQSATLTVSGPNMFSAGVSTGGNTLGTTGAVSQFIDFVGGNNVTLSQSTNGGSATITISVPSQTVQTQSIIRDVIISGNTSGTTADISSGTLTLAGGNNITLSQAGNAVTISGPNTVAQSTQPAVGSLNGSSGTLTIEAGTNITISNNASTISVIGPSNILNSFSIGGNTGTTGSSAITGGGFIIAGGSNITLSQSNATISIHGASQSVQADSHNIIAAGTQTGNTSGTVIFSNSNNVSFGMSNSSVITATATFSQSVQTQSTHVHIISGNTSGTTASMSTGTIVLAGGNNITLSQVGNAVTISALASSSLVQSGNVSISTNGSTITISGLGFAYASLSAGNTSGTSTLISSGTMYLAGGNSITLSQNGNSITISGATTSQSIQTNSIINGVSILTDGNTAGVMADITSGTLYLAGGNAITLSQNANSITISGRLGVSFGISSLGNTASESGTVSRLMVLVGSNNITLSGNVNAGSITVSIVAPSNIVSAAVIAGNTSGVTASISSGTLTLAGGNNITLSQAGNAVTISAQAIPDFGISNVGNTSGTSGTVNAQLILAGGNNITVSQSVNGQLATVTISAARGIILVSNSLVTASTQVLSFTGANVTDHAYTFHMYISNPLNATPVYSVMYNGVSAGITRDYMVGRTGTVTATSDNNPIAFNLSASEEGHQIVKMMFHTTPVRMYAIGNEATLGINQQAVRQTGTAATNVTAIVISANAANAIGPNSRIIWYKHG